MKYVALIFFLNLGYNHLIAQCSIKILKSEKKECSEFGFFDFAIEIQKQGGSNKIEIIGNGRNYGYFPADSQIVTLKSLKGDCKTDFEFLVRDSATTSCFDFVKIGTVCCTDFCKTRINQAYISQCNDKFFDLILDVKHNLSDKNYQVLLDNKLLNIYPYNPFPTILHGLDVKLLKDKITLVTCTESSKLCCDTVQLLSPCACNITDFKGTMTRCDTIKKEFDLSLNFNQSGVSDSFLLGGNSINYGKFAYKNLPVTLKNLKMGSGLDYEFLAVDSKDLFCFGSFNLGIVNKCDTSCSIQETKIEHFNCDGTQIYFDLNATIKNGGLNGINLTINQNNIYYKEYSGGNLLTGPYSKNCTSGYNWKIQDNIRLHCQAEGTLNVKSCCDSICSINNFTVQEKCIENDSSELIIDFKHTNINDTFTLFVQQKEIGLFAYANLPIKIKIANAGLPIINLKVIDKLDKNCTFDSLYAFLCYKEPKCNISNFSVLPSDCTPDGTYIATVFFEPKDQNSDLFVLTKNNNIIDTISGLSLPISTSLLTGICNELPILFKVRNLQDSLCFASFEIKDFKCCPSCTLDSVILTKSICQNGKYDLIINFNKKFTSNDFKLFVNDSIIGKYNYAQLPMTIKSINFQDSFTLKVQDDLYPSCEVQLKTNGQECTSSVTNSPNPKIEIKIINKWIEIIPADINQKYTYFVSNTLGQPLIYGNFNGNHFLELDHGAGVFYLSIMTDKIFWTKKLMIIH